MCQLSVSISYEGNVTICLQTLFCCCLFFSASKRANCVVSQCVLFGIPKETMEDEKTDEDFYVAKRMRQLKHCLVFIAFGAPMLFFLLNLLIWVVLNTHT